MSRSYKKTPRCGQKKDKFFKRYANRKLRRKKNLLLQNGSYKKDLCYYDICDYEIIAETFPKYWKRRLNLWYTYGRYIPLPYPDKIKEYKYWYHHYKRK